MAKRASSYYPLLRVITRYYWLLRFMGEKHLNISGNLIGLARVILLPVITRYYPLLPVITSYYALWGEKDLKICGNLIG